MKGLKISEETTLIECGEGYAIFHEKELGYWYWLFCMDLPEYTAEAWNAFNEEHDDDGFSCGYFDSVEELKEEMNS